MPTLGSYARLPGTEFDLEAALEAFMDDSMTEEPDRDAVPNDFENFTPAVFSDVEFDWADDVAENRPPTKKLRLMGKTSPADAALLGYENDPTTMVEAAMDEDTSSDESMMDDDLPAETTNLPQSVLDVHGGLFLRTDDILWCAKCGASAKIGWFSAYLRKACPGKPINSSMKQRRKRLIRGKHPTTCKPLESAPKRVRIV